MTDRAWVKCIQKGPENHYDTPAKANKQRTRGSNGNKKLFVYRCRACGKWALTHYSPDEWERIEQRRQGALAR